MAELSAVPFSALPPASDGYTVLYENDQVCRSDKKLSELVGSRTSSFLTKASGDELYQEKGNYLVPDDLDEYATQVWVENELSKIGSYIIVNETTGEDNHPDVENPSTKVIYLTKQTEGKFDNYNEWIYKDDTDTFECIGETTLDLENYYRKTETSGAGELSAALDGKEDKVFVAEYGVTTYADIKDAYDSGKQIICKYVENEAQTKYMSLSQFVKPANIFIFSDWATHCQSIYVHFTLKGDGTTDYQVISDWYYTQNETSGRNELANAFNTKQDILTFDGENNTITSINNSAVGGGSTGESNSWKQLSEEHGSSGTLDENFSIYLGEENSAYNASIIGHNNEALNSNVIGNSNTINKNLASDLALSGEIYTKTGYNAQYQYESTSVYIRNFVAGVGNSAEYAKNAYILGNENEVICDSSADYLNVDNDGFTYLFGYKNSAARNYDTAIGYKAIASGGENIAIGAPYETITGYSPYDGGSYLYDEVNTQARGYKNIAIRSNITGINNIAYNSTLTGSMIKLSSIWVNEELSKVVDNQIKNTWVSGTSTGNYAAMQRNIIDNSNIIFSSEAFNKNIITNTNSLNIVDNFNNNTILHSNDILISAIDNESYANNNTLIGCENLSLNSKDIVDNLFLNVRNRFEITANNNIKDNILIKTTVDPCSSISSINENIVFNSFISGDDVFAYRGWGEDDSATTFNKNFIFGTYVGNYVYNTFSFSDNSNSNPEYILSNTIRTFNFGDNSITKAEASFVFGLNNTTTAINRSFVFGYNNNLYKTPTNSTEDYIMDAFVFGNGNNIINECPDYKPTLERNTIFGLHNYIKSKKTCNDNYIVGLCNSITYFTNIPSKSDIIDNISYPTAPEFTTNSAAFQTTRNRIFGNGIKLTHGITDSFVAGICNYVIDTKEYLASDIPSAADYNSIYMFGVGNIAYDGSNQLNIGYNNETSGHFAEAIGDGIIAKEQQLIIGKCNAVVDGTNRYSIEYDSATDTIKNVEQSGVIFAIGNGTYDYATGTNEWGEPVYYDKNKDFIYPQENINNEEYITRSNALIVSANGVVSANDYYNAAGDKLSDLAEVIALLRNKPTTGNHVIKCIDGTLTWVAES